MINFKKIKKILILLIVVPTFSMLTMVFFNIIDKPDIKILNLKKIDNISTSKNIINTRPEITASNESFDYKLIGYRAGAENSSVIVKKGNEQIVVSIGEKLDGLYELVEVNKIEIIFSDNKNLYKITNLVGK